MGEPTDRSVGHVILGVRVAMSNPNDEVRREGARRIRRVPLCASLMSKGWEGSYLARSKQTAASVPNLLEVVYSEM